MPDVDGGPHVPRDDAIIIRWSASKAAYIYRLEDMAPESAVRILRMVANEIDRTIDADWNVVLEWSEDDEPDSLDDMEGFEG